MSPHTKKLPFSSRLSIGLKLPWPTHPYFLLYGEKIGDDKSAQAILSLFHYLFPQYVLITYYLHHWRLLLLYIFFE